MSSLGQFSGAGGVLPRGVLNNGTSVVSTGTNYAVALSTFPGVVLSVSGALSAGVLTNVLSISGQGVIDFFACASVDATSRTHRVKITLDGVVIYDGTTAAIAATTAWLIPIGGAIANAAISPTVIPQPLIFNQSLLIQYASSLAETGKTNFAYRVAPR